MKAKNSRVIDILKDLCGVDSAAVASEGVFYSESFPIENATYAFEYMFTSDGTVKVKVELEQGNEVPGTEGSADADWVVPDGALELDNECTDEINHIRAYAPCSAAFGRIKITGLSTNDASTVLSKLKMSIAK